jgi:hypothetical protein
MLDRGDCFGRVGRGLAEAEEKRVLVVTDDRDNANRPRDIRRHVDVWIFVF